MIAYRRARREIAWALSFCRFENVTCPTHGVDHRFVSPVDLLAQVRDVQLDDIGLTSEIVIPHSVKDLGFGEHSLGVAHEVAQQLELGGRQVDFFACSAYLPGVLVKGEVSNRQHGVGLGFGGPRTAQEGA